MAVAVVFLMGAVQLRSRAPLALFAALYSACAPGDFDDLHTRSEHAAQRSACLGDDAEGEPCEVDPDSDAEAEPETDAETEPGTAPGAAGDSVSEPATDAAACPECGQQGAAELDAEVCDACMPTPDAALCVDDAGSMCHSDAGRCLGAAPVCTMGQQQREQRACGACNTGSQTRTRSCAADGCGWGAWSAWSGCSGVTAACTPKQTTPCTNGDDCGQRVCSDSCTWGACVPKVANGCLRIRKGDTEQGSNFRCCGGAGHWQFCLPDCHWSTECTACSEGAPNYCSECY